MFAMNQSVLEKDAYFKAQQKIDKAKEDEERQLRERKSFKPSRGRVFVPSGLFSKP